MTAIDRAQPSTVSTMDVYRQWWLHDARWYQGVAKRFGHEAANEINAEAMRYVAEHVGRLVRKRAGGKPPGDIDELRDRYESCSDAMFPAELRDGAISVAGDDLVELTMRRNFAVTMVRMAGSLDGYECPCTGIHAGWSAGLGVRLTENCATSCLRHGDAECRLLMRKGE
ncbi:hypothetical protein [Amycolatopsis minnesotensis]|uniref:4-vinyl reductase 4VR domain-containing protein n=1 Tax=Amycolatopsis minnesotensis TaxID=337894 RepID=A0ABP5BBF3_9PSEU